MAKDNVIAVFKNRSVLSGMTAKEAMQKHLLRLPCEADIKNCIRHLIKFKTNAALIINRDRRPEGVVSKTDIIGAYYAGLPADTPLCDIMAGPPCVCTARDSLETAVEHMQAHGIHQIYVRPDAEKDIEGLVTYADIVGLIYRYCRTCIRSGRYAKQIAGSKIPPLIVRDVMTHHIVSCTGAQPIANIIENLSTQKLGALLVADNTRIPLGTISKTDLILAYTRGIGIDGSAAEIMNSPIVACTAETRLSRAVQQMFLADVQRIFVAEGPGSPVTGILALSDATRFRSGTCRACAAGRISEPPGN